MGQHTNSESTSGIVPLAVQIAFSGSRFLFDEKAHPNVDPAPFYAALQRYLTERLRILPQELGLDDRHFLCGLSQLGVGADTLFSRACATLNMPQRVLLPQQREDFLAAVGSDGAPDFTDEQRIAARKLFDSAHVIEERVVSASADRQTRFQEVNLELLRVSDLVVCLLNRARDGKPGGTSELIEEAEKRGRPLLEIHVDAGDGGQPQVSESWHHRDAFAVPQPPD
jgi:hypothetical protein